MIKLTKQVKASEDGVNINTFEPGEHDELPPVAMKRAVAIGAIADASGETEAEKAAREAKAKADAEAAAVKTEEERQAADAQAGQQAKPTGNAKKGKS